MNHWVETKVVSRISLKNKTSFVLRQNLLIIQFHAFNPTHVFRVLECGTFDKQAMIAFARYANQLL